MKYYNVKP
jgi:hypothetical protein